MSRKIRLLIVDDEERFLRTLSQRLRLRDFEVTPATNGQQAVEAAAQSSFDLALLDLKMPGMSGDELLALLKKKDPDIEVVILTGHGSVDSAVQCTRLGSFHYLQKPCETDELLQVLRDAYQARVQKKLALNEERMGELLGSATRQSPLAILRLLRELEEADET